MPSVVLTCSFNLAESERRVLPYNRSEHWTRNRWSKTFALNDRLPTIVTFSLKLHWGVNPLLC